MNAKLARNEVLVGFGVVQIVFVGKLKVVVLLQGLVPKIMKVYGILSDFKYEPHQKFSLHLKTAFSEK